MRRRELLFIAVFAVTLFLTASLAAVFYVRSCVPTMAESGSSQILNLPPAATDQEDTLISAETAGSAAVSTASPSLPPTATPAPTLSPTPEPTLIPTPAVQSASKAAAKPTVRETAQATATTQAAAATTTAVTAPQYYPNCDNIRNLIIVKLQAIGKWCPEGVIKGDGSMNIPIDYFGEDDGFANDYIRKFTETKSIGCVSVSVKIEGDYVYISSEKCYLTSA